MNALTVAIDVLGLLALPISIISLIRTLYRDQVVADLRFERDRLGDTRGFIEIENPLKHSVYLDDIVFHRPKDVLVSRHGQDTRSIIRETVDGKISARIPPGNTVQFDCTFAELNDGDEIQCTFKWGQLKWWWRLGFLFPSGLHYSAEEVKLRMRAAKRAEDGGAL
jgi:hypothetical protein